MLYYFYITQYYTIENDAYISHDKYINYYKNNKKRVRRDWRRKKTKIK